MAGDAEGSREEGRNRRGRKEESGGRESGKAVGIEEGMTEGGRMGRAGEFIERKQGGTTGEPGRVLCLPVRSLMEVVFI